MTKDGRASLGSVKQDSNLGVEEARVCAVSAEVACAPPSPRRLTTTMTRPDKLRTSLRPATIVMAAASQHHPGVTSDIERRLGVTLGTTQTEEFWRHLQGRTADAGRSTGGSLQRRWSSQMDVE